MEYYGALTVAALWGITNTLIRRAICIQPYVEHSRMCPKAVHPLRQFWRTLTYLPFFVPFLLNQFASLLFMWVLSRLPVTLAVPLVNSLTFVFTAAAGRALNERKITPHTIFGAILITVGITVTFLAD